MICTNCEHETFSNTHLHKMVEGRKFCMVYGTDNEFINYSHAPKPESEPEVFDYENYCRSCGSEIESGTYHIARKGEGCVVKPCVDPATVKEAPIYQDIETRVMGVKHDTDKERYDLVPATAFSYLVRVYTFGARKYADNNWRLGLKYTRVFGAIMRHLWAWFCGEDRDRESGLPHMAHAAWGCFTLLEFQETDLNQDDHMKLDDRFKT